MTTRWAGTNTHSLILARNFSVNLYFHPWKYKITMATFRTSQCQDGKENSKCYEWRCQGGAFKNALENLNARKSTSKNMLTGILSQNLWTYLYLDVFCCLQVSGSVAGGTYKWGETGLIPGEGDLWPDVSFCCWFTGKWTCNWGNLYVGEGGLLPDLLLRLQGNWPVS